MSRCISGFFCLVFGARHVLAGQRFLPARRGSPQISPLKDWDAQALGLLHYLRGKNAPSFESDNLHTPRGSHCQCRIHSCDIWGKRFRWEESVRKPMLRLPFRQTRGEQGWSIVVRCCRAMRSAQNRITTIRLLTRLQPFTGLPRSLKNTSPIRTRSSPGPRCRTRDCTAPRSAGT